MLTSTGSEANDLVYRIVKGPRARGTGVIVTDTALEIFALAGCDRRSGQRVRVVPARACITPRVQSLPSASGVGAVLGVKRGVPFGDLRRDEVACRLNERDIARRSHRAFADLPRPPQLARSGLRARDGWQHHQRAPGRRLPDHPRRMRASVPWTQTGWFGWTPTDAKPQVTVPARRSRCTSAGRPHSAHFLPTPRRR